MRAQQVGESVNAPPSARPAPFDPVAASYLDQSLTIRSTVALS